MSLKALEQFDEAIDCYQTALSLYPESAEAHFNLGNAFQENNDLKAAIESYTKALEINPDYREAKSAMGSALIRAGRHEDGLKFQNAGAGVIRFDIDSGVNIHAGK